VNARVLRDDARKRDFVELAIGRTRVRPDREARKKDRWQKEAGEYLLRGLHGRDGAVLWAIGQA
jgi:hypothetical protein